MGRSRRDSSVETAMAEWMDSVGKPLAFDRASGNMSGIVELDPRDRREGVQLRLYVEAWVDDENGWVKVTVVPEFDLGDGRWVYDPNYHHHSSTRAPGFLGPDDHGYGIIWWSDVRSDITGVATVAIINFFAGFKLPPDDPVWSLRVREIRILPHPLFTRFDSAANRLGNKRRVAVGLDPI